VQLSRTTTRRRPRMVLAVGALLMAAGVLTPSAASAEPGTAAEAREQVQQAAQELTIIDEQVHQAEITVAEQRAVAQTAAAAADEAQAALAEYEPILRAIATSGYTGENQSRVAAFLTSDSASELVQQMTTLDMIAVHTNEIIAQVAVLQDAAELAQAAADEAAATAEAGLAELQAQQGEVQKRIDQYQADFARLSAEEQAAVTAAVADGFDCSGLTSFAYAAAGVSLPHSSRSQSQMGREVSRSELQPGDLVYFYSPVSHVGLYIGNGMMVHARTFGQPVAVTSVDQGGYAGARRIVGE